MATKIRQPRQWSRLDNAAKIFPPSSSTRDPRVFRVAVELTQEADPESLQRALDKTLELFPMYKSVIKKGLFWYYLEASDLKAAVSEECELPCSPILFGNRKRLLFKVSYYKFRINLEVYHALSDGTGALQFLRTLIVLYLQDKHGCELDKDAFALDYDAARSERDDDSFLKYFSKERGGRPRNPRAPKAYQIRGDMLPAGQMSITEGLMPSSKIKAAAKAYGATITEFLTAVLVTAIGEGMSLRQRLKPVNISVPVNLRQYFPSLSARNFFAVITVRCKLGPEIVFEDVLAQIRRSFADELTEEKIRTRMNTLAALEHNVAMKAVPLVLKNPIMHAAVMTSKRQITAGLSNVGQISLPEQLSKYIRLVDAFSSTRNLQVILVSYRDSFVINFTSVFHSTDIQRRFFRHITRLGIECEISTNWTDNRDVLITEGDDEQRVL